MRADFAANPLHMRQKSATKPKGLPRGRPFLKGQSGNPAGKRPGTRNRATIIAERGRPQSRDDGGHIGGRECELTIREAWEFS